jgi:succinate-semialdehyde dehydrogenase/glutarate-semialdehyde dehydrogenase
VSHELKSVNPHTGELIQKHSALSLDELSTLLRSAKSVFDQWRKTPLKERRNFLEKLKTALIEKQDELSQTMTLEMGKPLAQSQAELKKCEKLCEYYAEILDKELQKNEGPWTKLIKTEHKKSYTSLQPKGAILGIMPWNFPFWQVFRFAVPNLMIGNTVYLKHAPNTQLCAKALELLFQKASKSSLKPEESPYKNLSIQESEVEEVLKDPILQGVSLTGSSQAGKSVAALAGKYMKKSVFELGGSDPYLIFQDADIAHAAKLCVKSRLINSGQSCIAAKRFIVHKLVANDFIDEVLAELKDYRLGDPMDESSHVGPLAREDLLLKLEKQVKESLQSGAKCLYESKLPASQGFYSPIRLLTEVDPQNPAFRDELFGPVAVVIKAGSDEEMIKLANQSDYGLGAALFSKDIEKARKIGCEEIQSGAVSINDFVKSDPRLPFGGVKDSGYGRELAEEGLFEFGNLKTITED